jgi:hypothetical protein
VKLDCFFFHIICILKNLIFIFKLQLVFNKLVPKLILAIRIYFRQVEELPFSSFYFFANPLACVLLYLYE